MCNKRDGIQPLKDRDSKPAEEFQWKKKFHHGGEKQRTKKKECVTKADLTIKSMSHLSSQRQEAGHFAPSSSVPSS